MSFGIESTLSQHSVLYKITVVIINTLIYIRRYFAKILSVQSDTLVIVALHKLGDTIFTIPAIKLIINDVHLSVTIVCFEESRYLYELVFKNVNIITLNKNDFLFNQRIAKLSANKKVKTLKPKLIFDLTGVMTSATLIYNTGAEKIIGFNRPFFRAIYTHFREIKDIKHSIDIYLQAISSYLKFEPGEVETSVAIQKSTYGVIGICPFAGWAAKEWGIKNFISLAIYLNNKYKVKIIVPAAQIADDIRNELVFNNITYVETKTVAELINQLASTSLIIGNDSGPIHIASLFGIPTFTIYGPTNPAFHLPFGKHHQAVQKKIKCSPSDSDRFCFTNAGINGCPSNECLKTLTVGEVISELKKFIEYLNLSEDSVEPDK